MSDTDQPSFEKDETPPDNQGGVEAGSAKSNVDSDSSEEKSEESKDDKPAKKQAEQQTRKGTVSLKNKYQIHTNKPIEYLNNGPVRAFKAESSANKNMFAMLCETHLPARFRDTDVYDKNTESSLFKLADSGAVLWTPEGVYKHVFVYEGAPGKPILDDPKGAALGMKPELVMRSFLKPVISALKGLRDLDLYHGHVRLDNIYGASEGGSFDSVTLGDCLSLPAGFTDQSIYLPVHKAIAQPSGRGLGNISEDLYALGVCAAIMLRSADPTKNMSEKDVLRLKLAQGSYMTLTNKDRFSGGILELLRGLLQDDPSQRWTMEEVVSWLDGQRLVPKQGVKRNKAARPFVLGDQKHYYAETLAIDMPDHQAEAAPVIENEELEQWLIRSVEDSKKVEKLEIAIRTAREYGRTSFYWDRLVCRTSLVLDPKQPIRYRNYSVFPDGFGNAMAEAFKEKRDMNPFIQMINQQIVPYWISLQGETFVDIGAVATAFEDCRNSIRQQKPGYGLERCVYVLSTECPCLSEQYDRYVIREAVDLLIALEEMAESGRVPKDIFDPHMTAFLLVRNNRLIDSHLPELNSKEGYRRILGTIKVLASIQKNSDIKEVKALTKWAQGYVEPFFERFHDSKIREEKKKEIEKIKGKGDLTAFVKIMDDAQALQKDSVEFKRAIRDYYKLKLEKYKYEKALANRETYGQDTGREIGAIVSGIIASAIILVITFIFFSGGSVVP